MNFREWKIDLWNLMIDAACAEVKNEDGEAIDKLRQGLVKDYPEHWVALCTEVYGKNRGESHEQRR